MDIDADELGSWYGAGASDSDRKKVAQAIADRVRAVLVGQGQPLLQGKGIGDVHATVEACMATYSGKKASSKARKWLSRLSSRINYYGNILDVLVQHHPEYVSLAWGAFKFLFVAVQNHEGSISLLAKALSQIGDALPRVEFYTVLYPSQHIITAVEELYTQILIFLERAMRWCCEGSLKHAIHSITRPHELEYRDILDRVEELSRQLDRLASSASQAELRAVHQKMDMVLRKFETLDGSASMTVLNTRLQTQEATLQDVKRTILEFQATHASAAIDTNHRLSDLQFSSIMASISITVLGDAQKTYSSQLAFSKHLQIRHGTCDIRQLCTSTRLSRWSSASSSDLLVVRGTYSSRLTLKQLCIGICEQLHEAKIPCLMAMVPTASRKEEGTTGRVSSVDVLKHLTLQALQASQPLQTEKSMSMTCAQFQTATTPREWFGLFEMALSRITTPVYLIVDLEVLDCSLTSHEGFSWGATFLRAIGSDASVPLILNNQNVHKEKIFAAVGPYGEVLGLCSCADTEFVEDAIQSCQDAFQAWSTTRASHRRDLLLTAADVMKRRKEELREYMRHEIESADGRYQDFIIDLATEGLIETAGRISEVMTGSLPEANQAGMKAMVQKRPYGVNVGIAPWNAPYHLGLRSVLFAIATGNTVVLKGSETAPRCYWAIADVFREAGLPDGVLNLVFHAPEDEPTLTYRLLSHAHVKKINFTGSPRMGRFLAQAAGSNLKPVLMELSGKATAIVLRDADLELAARHCAQAASMDFHHFAPRPGTPEADRICLSTHTILVDESVARSFQEALQEAVRARFASSEAVPVVAQPAWHPRRRDIIADVAVAEGVSSLPALRRPPRREMRTRVRRAMLLGRSSRVVRSKAKPAGSGIPIFSFETEEKAVGRANDTRYGFVAAVFSGDLQRAFRLAGGLRAGAVHINSMTVNDEYSLPHGGVKQGGFGRFNGHQGMDEFLYSKTVTWIE